MGVHHGDLLKAGLGHLGLSDVLVREVDVVFAQQVFLKPQIIVRSCNEHDFCVLFVVFFSHSLHSFIKISSLISSNYRFPVLNISFYFILILPHDNTMMQWSRKLMVVTKNELKLMFSFPFIQFRSLSPRLA